MSKVKIELNNAGIRELLKSPEVMALCVESANQVRSRAGDGFEVESYTGFDRAHAVVFADTPEAKRDNLENNTLLKAVGGGR